MAEKDCIIVDGSLQSLILMTLYDLVSVDVMSFLSAASFIININIHAVTSPNEGCRVGKRIGIAKRLQFPISGTRLA